MHNILIVDDQSDILRILEREFRRHGDYSVTTANNPSDALDAMDKAPVELVISDVRLGNQTGFSLLQQVNERHPGVGTILMTAYRSPAYRQQADALGVSFFLEKPFPVATLITAVDRFFQERLAQAEAKKITESGEMNTMAHFKAQDLVQLFCLNGRNVRVTLNVGPDQPPGYIYIQRGRVIHAELGDKVGEAAFQDLILNPDATLSLQDWDSAVEPTIQSAWEHLLLEAARQQDSNGEEEDFVPDTGDLIPIPARPLPMALADPFGDFWKVAQIPNLTPPQK